MYLDFPLGILAEVLWGALDTVVSDSRLSGADDCLKNKIFLP